MKQQMEKLGKGAGFKEQGYGMILTGEYLLQIEVSGSKQFVTKVVLKLNFLQRSECHNIFKHFNFQVA